MKVLVISDLHADVESLTIALAKGRELGCSSVLCAGDLVDGASFPDELIAILESQSIPTVRGNHDRWATEEASGSRPSFGSGAELSSASLEFLRSLPYSFSATFEEVRIRMWHASPRSDMHGLDERDVPAIKRPLGGDVLIVGHTHDAFSSMTQAGELVCNPGSLAAPRYVEKGGGTFGVLELPVKKFTIHRIGKREGAVGVSDHCQSHLQ
jgi:putative phosphoesterase